MLSNQNSISIERNVKCTDILMSVSDDDRAMVERYSGIIIEALVDLLPELEEVFSRTSVIHISIQNFRGRHLAFSGKGMMNNICILHATDVLSTLLTSASSISTISTSFQKAEAIKDFEYYFSLLAIESMK